ncbi:helix-turn-helix transcriptional regulator [Desulfovibrio litoralis]|uniref:Helix-turn-helix domain-containing protein n=1 Tax=Desulfovibrio litoralis DSM 11393 TaxID=1121455 RepID=A0A1M7TLH3_9BACT|nr:helix-turn-helix domain-containing protein [Desulfovibrio litoralis]SHN71577.1 Helix-turn-helix domain-containing protein [Desulfovibrio litoralis DSM 11393]
MSKKLNTIEAAEYLGVKRGTMEVWRSLGKGPRFSKLGTRVVYEIQDLDSFVSDRKVETCDTFNFKKGGVHA